MGGRGAHEDRDENGRMKHLTYRTDAVFETTYMGKTVHVKLLSVADNSGKRGLPSYSNSPDSIYAILDQKTGRVETVRIYRNHKAFLDLDYHEGQKEHGRHWHYNNFDKSEGKKGKTGRSTQHPSTEKLKEGYQALVKLLNQYPQDILSNSKGENNENT